MKSNILECACLTITNMEDQNRWYYKKSQLVDTPSRRCGIDSDKELGYRQQLANFIQDMGQKLQVQQLCINTAIVYMHRFFMCHSFQAFNKHSMASACVFLAAKVEEQPRKLEHVIKVIRACLKNDLTPIDTKSEDYLQEAQELVINENILLQALGFEITVDHPHTHVLKTCHLVKATKDLAQTSYFLATNSLHLTTMCLQYKPSVVACVCIHLACKWSSWEIPRSSEGKEWFTYTDKSVTMEVLEELTQDFLTILEKCPSKLKKKIMAKSTVCAAGLKQRDDDKKKNQEANSSSNSNPLKNTHGKPVTEVDNKDKPNHKLPNSHSDALLRKTKTLPIDQHHVDAIKKEKSHHIHKRTDLTKGNSHEREKHSSENRLTNHERNLNNSIVSNENGQNDINSINHNSNTNSDVSKLLHNSSNSVSDILSSVSKEKKHSSNSQEQLSKSHNQNLSQQTSKSVHQEENSSNSAPMFSLMETPPFESNGHHPSENSDVQNALKTEHSIVQSSEHSSKTKITISLSQLKERYKKNPNFTSPTNESPKSKHKHKAPEEERKDLKMKLNLNPHREEINHSNEIAHGDGKVKSESKSHRKSEKSSHGHSDEVIKSNPHNPPLKLKLKIGQNTPTTEITYSDSKHSSKSHSSHRKHDHSGEKHSSSRKRSHDSSSHHSHTPKMARSNTMPNMLSPPATLNGAISLLNKLIEEKKTHLSHTPALPPPPPPPL